MASKNHSLNMKLKHVFPLVSFVMVSNFFLYSQRKDREFFLSLLAALIDSFTTILSALKDTMHLIFHACLPKITL